MVKLMQHIVMMVEPTDFSWLEGQLKYKPNSRFWSHIAFCDPIGN